MNRLLRLALLCAATTLAACATMDRALPGKPEYMIVGIDNKDDVGRGRRSSCSARPARTSVAIVDIGTDPANPKIVATLPLIEFDLRPADQPRDHAERPARAGGQLGRVHRRRLRLEIGARPTSCT